MKFADFNKDGKVSNENKIVYLNRNIVLFCIRSVYLKHVVFGHLYKLMNLFIQSYYQIMVIHLRF